MKVEILPFDPIINPYDVMLSVPEYAKYIDGKPDMHVRRRLKKGWKYPGAERTSAQCTVIPAWSIPFQPFELVGVHMIMEGVPWKEWAERFEYKRATNLLAKISKKVYAMKKRRDIINSGNLEGTMFEFLLRRRDGDEPGTTTEADS